MKKVKIKELSNTVIVLAALVVLGIALSVASPYFATQNNLINIVLQANQCDTRLRHDFRHPDGRH